MKMDESDQARVQAAYTDGAEHFSEKDLKRVMEDQETAEKKGSKLGEQLENFKLLWQLLQDYSSGRYRNVPWRLIAAAGFAAAYLIAPADVIPDVLPVIGLVDDASVFALVVAGFQAELKIYKQYLLSREK